jgi:hypothetical protein
MHSDLISQAEDSNFFELFSAIELAIDQSILPERLSACATLILISQDSAREQWKLFLSEHRAEDYRGVQAKG